MKINGVPNGPYVIDTPKKVTVKLKGNVKNIPAPIYLCRCGHTKNAPLCDGNHKAANFVAEQVEVDIE